MLLVLPVLAIPFITLAFWSMGGGKGLSADRIGITTAEGLNLQLPDSRLTDDKAMTKLGYYEKAAYDSAKREESVRNDPYFKMNVLRVDSNASYVAPDSNEEKVRRKLAALDKELNKKNAVIKEDELYSITGKQKDPAPDIDRLEQMMRMQQNPVSPDPEMNQLNGMLDKIMDIQHPERFNEQVKQNSSRHPETTYPVNLPPQRNNISLLVSETEWRSKLYTDTGFYSIQESPDAELNSPNAIEAVIHETRTLVNGSIVKLRLLTDIYINGTLLPKGNFVYGKASLNGERLNIEIASLLYKNSLYPVSLSVYDMDGMDGVFIPGAISRDVAKESADRAIQGLALNSLDPSIGAQAAGAGIETAKNLLTKKVKLVKVVVKAGYKVLLKDKKQR